MPAENSIKITVYSVKVYTVLLLLCILFILFKNDKFAQEVCDLMVSNGIKAILTFTQEHLELPDDIVVKNENLAYSLALLSIELKIKHKIETKKSLQITKFNGSGESEGV